jgi:hypothetical protein
MLYPLSYEGGELDMQVRPYFSRSSHSCPWVPCPWRARSVGERRFIELSRVAVGLGSKLPDARETVPRRAPGCSHVIPMRIAACGTRRVPRDFSSAVLERECPLARSIDQVTA